LVSGKTFHGHAEISPERSFRGIESREEVSLECGSEEALRQVLGIFVIFVEFEADKAVDGFPIQRNHAIEGLSCQTVSGDFEQRKLRGREMAKRPADGSIWVHV